jgi:hypothetical protein
MSSPPLSQPRHRAGLLKRPVPRIAGSRWPQALVQIPQAAPREELRLDALVILSWPVADRGEELAVVPSPYQAHRARTPGRPVRAKLRSRQIVRPTLLRALHSVPSCTAVCADLPGHGLAASGGAVLLLETGAEFPIGINSLPNAGSA